MFAANSFDPFHQDDSQLLNWDMDVNVEEWDPLCATLDRARRESDFFGVASESSDSSSSSAAVFVSEWPIFPSELEGLGGVTDLQASSEFTQDLNSSYSETTSTMDVVDPEPEKTPSPNSIRTKKAKERLYRKFCATMKVSSSSRRPGSCSPQKKKEIALKKTMWRARQTNKPKLKLKKTTLVQVHGETVVFSSPPLMEPTAVAAAADAATEQVSLAIPTVVVEPVAPPPRVPAAAAVVLPPIDLYTQEDWRALYPSPSEATLIDEIVSKFTDSHCRVIDAFILCMAQDYGGHVLFWSSEHIEFRITNVMDVLAIIDLAVSRVTGKSSIYCRWKALRSWFQPLPLLETRPAGPDNCRGFIVSDKKRQERLAGLHRAAFRTKVLKTLDNKYNPKGKLNFTFE